MLALALVLQLSATAAPAKAPETFSKEGKGWHVTAAVEGDGSASKPSRVVLTLTSRDGFKVNEEYPLNFRAKGSSGVRLAKERSDKSDGLELEACDGKKEESCSARLPVSFTPDAAKASVAGTFSFSVCTAEQCLIEKLPVTVPVKQ